MRQDATTESEVTSQQSRRPAPPFRDAKLMKVDDARGKERTTYDDLRNPGSDPARYRTPGALDPVAQPSGCWVPQEPQRDERCT
jgi:hypothetical protein